MTGLRGKPEVLLAAVLLDLLGGDPPDHFHPVSWFGRLARAWEREACCGRAARPALGSIGAVFLPSLCAVGVAALVGRTRGWRALLLEAGLLKSTFTVRGLIVAANDVLGHLEAGDLPHARERLRSLVSRDVSALDRRLVTSAVVESLAENAVDSFLAPWFYYASAGLPGAAAYRAVNTLDSMWGYRNETYERFGKAAARLDDVVNYLPATAGARLVLLAGGLLGLAAAEGRRALARDGARTESPNAGRMMSAMAGVLGVQLEKPGAYVLGDSLRPLDEVSIREAQRTVAATAALGLALAVALIWLRGGRD